MKQTITWWQNAKDRGHCEIFAPLSILYNKNGEPFFLSRAMFIFITPCMCHTEFGLIYNTNL